MTHTSVNSIEVVQERVKQIDQLLKSIDTEMEKYRSLEPRACHWGYAGDLGHIEQELGKVWEFISESGN